MEWIVFNEDNLPTQNEVLISNGSYVKVAQFGIKKGEPFFYDGTGTVNNVTHWMPLPPPPKKDDKEEK